jgi:hypothetical protein
VVTAFTAAPACESPNVRTSSDGDAALVYASTMVVMFASARRHAPELALELVTDQPPAEPFARQLADLGVDISLVPFAHRPPMGFSRTFNTSLYQLDAMAHHRPGDAVLYSDPDVVFIDDPATMFAAVAHGTVGAYPLSATRETDGNGLTAAQAEALYRAWDGDPATSTAGFTYYGGECYVIGSAEVDLVRRRAERAWEWSVRRHLAGDRVYPRTEEHLLNHALRKVPVTPLTGHVARIWTTARVRDVPTDPYSLTMWHVPAEKGAGFDRLYEAAMSRTGWFWSADRPAFRAACARELGIANRRPTRIARDVVGRVVAGLSTVRN